MTLSKSRVSAVQLCSAKSTYASSMSRTPVSRSANAAISSTGTELPVGALGLQTMVNAAPVVASAGRQIELLAEGDLDSLAILQFRQDRIQRIRGHRIRQRAFFITEGPDRDGEQVIAAVAAHDVLGPDAVQLGGSFAKGVAQRVGVAPKLFRLDLGQRLHHLRRRRIGVLIRIELDDIRRLRLEPRRIPRRLFHVVTKITHSPESCPVGRTEAPGPLQMAAGESGLYACPPPSESMNWCWDMPSRNAVSKDRSFWAYRFEATAVFLFCRRASPYIIVAPSQ